MLKTKLVNAVFYVAIITGLILMFWLVLPFLWKFSSSRQTVSTPAILQQVQTLSQLVTVKYVMEKAVFHESDDPSMWDYLPGGGKRVVLLAHGIVKAGIDFGELKKEDISVSGTNITIKLPPARVTDTYLDEKQTKVVDYKQGLFRSFDKDLEQNARQQAVMDINRAAREAGILKDADERAKSQIKGFFEQMGFHVEFR